MADRALVERSVEVGQMDPALQVELLNALMALADTKRALGLRYAEWCDRAPRLEAGVAASAMAQDQLGQTRVLYAVIEQLPGAPANLEDETREHTFKLAYLDQPFRNWTTFVAANLLIGAAVTLVEEGWADSRFTPLRTRIPKMLEEERFHRTHAEGWFKHLQAAGAHVRAEQAEAIEEMLPGVLCWFGDAQHAHLAGEKIIAFEPSELRERYLSRVGPFIQWTGARDLVRCDEQAQNWSYTRPLPWNEFDPITGRVGKQRSDAKRQ